MRLFFSDNSGPAAARHNAPAVAAPYQASSSKPGSGKQKTPSVLTGNTTQALEQARSYLMSLQTKQGFWEARVFDNVTITAEYTMALAFLDLLDTTTGQKLAEAIFLDQLPDGGWSIYGDGSADHSATVEAYFALKLCGIDPSRPQMRKAQKKALEGGGIKTTRVFTKIHLALFGQCSWDEIPVITPELILMPRQSPINIYEFSSWSRAVIIPLLIIFDTRPCKQLPSAMQIQDLWIPDASMQRRKDVFEHFFELSQKVLGVYERVPIKPFRKKALNLAEQWIVEHQDPNGNWGGIFPAIANSMIALHLRGYSIDHEIMQKGLHMLRSFTDETDSFIRMQSTVSPVWDTAIAAFALLEAGVPSSDPLLQKALSWLIDKQILDVEGDWRFKALPTRPGGWPFEHENDHYPDIDDTALAILSLLPRESDQENKKQSHQKVTKAIDRGIEWILGMQGSDGGWGAFDRDNNREILNQIPFADLKSLIDPSTPDVTGHVIEALGAAGFSLNSRPVQQAISFLEKTQEKTGAWFGRWGVNYIYGTSAVLSGLQALEYNMKAPWIKKAVKWLESVQNSDGGWGESCASYDYRCYVPLGSSTASQTAWAVIGLMSSPMAKPASIEAGIRYLLNTIQPDGSWQEPEYTGTGFPRHFYLRYDYYRLYFPVLALGRFVARQPV